MTQQPISFSERLAQMRAERGEPTPEPSPQVPPKAQNVDADLIPEVYERNESDQLIDDTIKKVLSDPISAYVKFIGKTVAVDELGNEEVHVSCPFPHHPDKNPSAWINTKEGTWFCGGCQEGGDIYDLAAIAYGATDYKSGANFHRLRENMAEAYGTHIKRVAGGQTIAWRDDAPAPQPQTPAAPEPAPQNPGAVDPPAQVQQVPIEQPQPIPGQSAADSFGAQALQAEVAPVTQLHSVPVTYDEEDQEALIAYPTLNWRSILEPDTFLYEYMTAASNDDSPEEYHFWHGMLALGHVVGKNVTLADQPAVNANLLLCLLGGTGYGKSKSRRYLNTVLDAVSPFRDNGDRTTGVKVVPTPGSGEFLVKLFEHETKDPSTNKPTGRFNSVNGIVDYDEFSGLLARANRTGSTLKQTIMGFADCAPRVSIGSLGQGVIQAHEPFCSITATTQPRAIRAILSKADQSSGFLNRWVFAGGPRKEKEVFGGSAHGGTHVDLSRAIDQLKLVKGWGGATERSVTIDPEALPTIVHFFRSKIYPIQLKDDTDLLNRVDLIYKKVLLLLTINSRRDIVTLDLHERCAQIVDYLIQCYGLVSSNIGITGQHEIAEDIMRHMERHYAKHRKGASARDLSRYMHRKNYTPQQIKVALDNLVALDWIEIEAIPPGAGRKTVRYRKVDAG